MQRFLLAFSFGYIGKPGTVQYENPYYEISEDYPNLKIYFGIVSGVLFALPLSVFGIFVGVVIPGINRKYLLCVGCLVWSAITYLQGFTDSFLAFCALRGLHGIVMSVCNPLAYSLIRDYFPPQNRSTANSLYSSGIYLGNALASLSIIMIKNYGWRNTFKFVAITGGVIGILGILILVEPIRDKFTVL